MILFISLEGETLPVVQRIQQEGMDARIYVHEKRNKLDYRGILPQVSIGKLKKTIADADMVVFDLSKAYDPDSKEDVALSKIFRVKPDKNGGLFGSIADRIKMTGKPVIGSSRQTEGWELDRWKGEEVAKKIGLNVPPSEKFDSLKEGEKFLRANAKNRWVFKPMGNKDLDLTYVEKFPGELADKIRNDYSRRVDDKIEFILQEVIDGHEISTEGWWNGEGWLHMNHTIEDKRLMNGNLGMAIGSQNNTVWLKKKKGLLTEHFARLAPIIKRTGYLGPVDINCIVSAKDHKPYFLEFSPRIGYDAIYCLLSLLKGKVGDFFAKGFAVPFHTDKFASSERISIPPYPYADAKLLWSFARDVPIHVPTSIAKMMWLEDVYYDKGLKCAGADGILGVMAASGDSLGGSVGNTYRAIKQLRVGSYLQYRTDLGRRAEKVWRDFNKWGVEIG